jgi:hypothetical protein
VVCGESEIFLQVALEQKTFFEVALGQKTCTNLHFAQKLFVKESGPLVSNNFLSCQVTQRSVASVLKK